MSQSKCKERLRGNVLQARLQRNDIYAVLITGDEYSFLIDLSGARFVGDGSNVWKARRLAPPTPSRTCNPWRLGSTPVSPTSGCCWQSWSDSRVDWVVLWNSCGPRSQPSCVGLPTAFSSWRCSKTLMLRTLGK